MSPTIKTEIIPTEYGFLIIKSAPSFLSIRRDEVIAGERFHGETKQYRGRIPSAVLTEIERERKAAAKENE